MISSLLWFALMIMFWFILPTMIYRREKTFKDNFRVNIDSNGFAIENSRGGREWAWSEFSEWMESPHFFHLYFNSRSFFIVPKEAFEGDQEHESRRIISANIRKKG